MLRWEHSSRGARAIPLAIILIMALAQPAGANSFGNLNLFGYPAVDGLTGSDSAISGLSDVTSRNGVLSASSASVSPASQYTGFFGAGQCGLWSGMSFAYPAASHDASSIAYNSNVAFEANTGNDAISFPDINVNLGSTGTSFPSILSSNSGVKYAESQQFLISTESDTMPLSGFSFPSGFGGFPW